MDYRGTVKVMSSRGPRAVVMGAAPVPVAGSLSNSARQVPVAPWLISKPTVSAGASAVDVDVNAMTSVTVKLVETLAV